MSAAGSCLGREHTGQTGMELPCSGLSSPPAHQASLARVVRGCGGLEGLQGSGGAVGVSGDRGGLSDGRSL